MLKKLLISSILFSILLLSPFQPKAEEEITLVSHIEIGCGPVVTIVNALRHKYGEDVAFYTKEGDTNDMAIFYNKKYGSWSVILFLDDPQHEGKKIACLVASGEAGKFDFRYLLTDFNT